MDEAQLQGMADAAKTKDDVELLLQRSAKLLDMEKRLDEVLEEIKQLWSQFHKLQEEFRQQAAALARLTEQQPGAAAAAGSEVPAVTYFALLVDDGNPKLVMIRDPHKDEPDKPFWKLIGHTGQPHQITMSHLEGLKHWRGTGVKATAEISHYDCKDAWDKNVRVYVYAESWGRVEPSEEASFLAHARTLQNVRRRPLITRPPVKSEPRLKRLGTQQRSERKGYTSR
uniref:Uncharacterized protein n=1 Tax=Cryptomonas curvata TaxID=233186 RepID=A0A7S0M107_9CRYP|mmetsp:Transcript_15960/g.33933  ORF Transcript_15960/g.33933 Transcript_15960/m.33933 type:complete len:227 (+) Transcript_15960:888-1568(+)